MRARGVARLLVSAVAVGAVTAAGLVGYDALRHTVTPLFTSTGCSATVDGRTVDLDSEQAENASLIAAIAVERGLPARAASIALATAYQESKIYNLTSGDRDSLGLFQQRPSQGWGTRAEVMDPVHATNAFYDALVRIDGYQAMPITDAAQRVQHSGYPEAYAAHEADARVLASALTGNSAHAFTCTVGDDSPSPVPQLVRSRVRKEVGDLFGNPVAIRSGGTLAVGVAGHGAVSRTRGWAISQYLVAQAERLGLRAVAFDGRVWSADHSGKGWQADPGASPGVTVDVA